MAGKDEVYARITPQGVEHAPCVELLMEEEQVGIVKVTTTQRGKLKRKIQQLYKKSDASLSYVTQSITHNNATYFFNYPLRSSLTKEEEY